MHKNIIEFIEKSKSMDFMTIYNDGYKVVYLYKNLEVGFDLDVNKIEVNQIIVLNSFKNLETFQDIIDKINYLNIKMEV